MVSLEWFLLVNLMMNLLILSAGARHTGHLSAKRLLIAALIGTAYSLAVFALPLPWTGSILWAAAVLALMTGMLFRGGAKGKKALIRTAAWTAAAGGIQTIAKAWIAHDALWVFAGGAAVAILCFIGDGGVRGSGETEGGTVRMRIGTRMGETEVEAVRDTGNRLREPLSGLPVVVVSANRLEGILDMASLDRQKGRIPVGFRKVGYGTLNGTGEMCCFRPESVFCEEGGCWREAEDVWIAVYPGRLPSDIDALAPPELLEGRICSGAAADGTETDELSDENKRR